MQPLRSSFCVFLTIAAVGLSMTLHAATLSVNGKTYALTTATYTTDSDHTAAVQSEFGAGASVADFAVLKNDVASNPDQLWNFLTNEGVTAVWSNYNGQQTTESYTYFVELHATGAPGGWTVIDSIDPSGPATIDLGRWNVLPDLRILSVVPSSVSAVPEASGSLTIAGLLSVGVLMRRRKRI